MHWQNNVKRVHILTSHNTVVVQYDLDVCRLQTCGVVSERFQLPLVFFFPADTSGGGKLCPGCKAMYRQRWRTPAFERVSSASVALYRRHIV